MLSNACPSLELVLTSAVAPAGEMTALVGLSTFNFQLSIPKLQIASIGSVSIVNNVYVQCRIPE